MKGEIALNKEYRQALYEVEILRGNLREVDPEFQDVVYRELLAAEEKLNSIIKEKRAYRSQAK